MNILGIAILVFLCLFQTLCILVLIDKVMDLKKDIWILHHALGAYIEASDKERKQR